LNQTLFHEIPREILAALLDHEGAHGVLSPRPLMGRAGGVNRHQLAELYAGNFVELPYDDKIVSTPEFAHAAQVLLNPATQITFRIWRDEAACAETSALFPGDLIDAGGVILNQIDGSYQMVSPVSLDDVIRLISPVIPPMDNKAAVFDFEGNFEIPVAAVLFGLIDMVRLHAGGGTDQQDTEAACFSLAQISAFLEGWGTHRIQTPHQLYCRCRYDAEAARPERSGIQPGVAGRRSGCQKNRIKWGHPGSNHGAAA